MRPSLSNFSSRLEDKKREGLFRDPKIFEKSEGKYLFYRGQKILNFSSNDYLGLSGEEINSVTSSLGAGSSRLVSASSSLMYEVESLYASYFGYKEALFFPSGFLANMSLITTLVGKEDLVFLDKRLHASFIKPLQLSQHPFFSFQHNHFSHLEKRLSQKNNNEKASFVCVESLYSMDGTLLDISALKELKNKHSFMTVVDEAHSFGVLGEKGSGLAFGVADIAVGTLGKAFGLHGAFLLFSDRLFKDYFLNFCESIIYSTALSPHFYECALKRLHRMTLMDREREKLLSQARWTKDLLKKKGWTISGEAYILSIVIGDEEKAQEISTKMFKKGFYIFSARSPTVPKGEALLRLSLTVLHEEEDILAFVEALEEVLGE